MWRPSWLPGVRDHPAWRHPFSRAALHAAPYALVIGLLLAAGVVVGANVANATPSERRPFGWPGPAGFDAGVATERAALVLAATVPPLVMGILSFGGMRRPRRTWTFLGETAVHAAMLWLGVWLGACLATVGVARTSQEGFLAFTVAHGLLACAWYGIGVLASVGIGRAGPPVAAGLGVLYLQTYEGWVRWKVFRQVGYHGIVAQSLPLWFYTAQFLSPLASYRGILVLWHKGFRDWEERAVLDGAILPLWVNPGLFALILSLWFLIPVQLSSLRVALSERREARAQAPPVPAPMPSGGQ